LSYLFIAIARVNQVNTQPPGYAYGRDKYHDAAKSMMDGWMTRCTDSSMDFKGSKQIGARQQERLDGPALRHE